MFHGLLASLKAKLPLALLWGDRERRGRGGQIEKGSRRWSGRSRGRLRGKVREIERRKRLRGEREDASDIYVPGRQKNATPAWHLSFILRCSPQPRSDPGLDSHTFHRVAPALISVHQHLPVFICLPRDLWLSSSHFFISL